MNNKKILIWSCLSVLIITTSWYGYKRYTRSLEKPLFKTQKIERKDIHNTVNVEGTLEALGTSKIGPLIVGTIKKIHVKEDQAVTKGELLAELDNGLGGDTNVRQKLAQLKTAKLAFVYIKENFKRKEALYKSGQLAKDAFEKAVQEYKTAKADIDNKQASYDQDLVIYKQTKITAPHNGTILSIPMKEGESVSPAGNPTPVLFELAQDLGTMKATLSIDENKIGHIKLNQKVNITVDTYPYKTWKGTVSNIGHAPMAKDKDQQQQQKVVSYKTEVILKNDEQLLRPGMTVHAKIKIGKAKKALAVPGFAFYISSKNIEAITKELKYNFKPIDPAKKKELVKQKKETPVKFLWVVDGKTFTERPVELGITDNAFFEIKSGITEQDNVLYDIEETDAMKELFKKWFGGGL